VPSPIAGPAGSGDVILGVLTAFLPGDQVLRGALQTGDSLRSDAELAGNFVRMVKPHGQVAVIAATVLTVKGVETGFGKLTGH